MQPFTPNISARFTFTVLAAGAHLQIVFSPLNETRDGLVRDASGKPASWLVEYYETSASATGGKAPANVTPLQRDIFTSKDFYSDRDLWMDKRYYRCNSAIAPVRRARA